MLQKSLAPAVLLASLVTVIAASPRAQKAEAQKTAPVPVAAAVAAPVAPAAVAVAAPAPAAIAAPAVATPAVVSPANRAFAQGVEGLSPKVLAMALDAVACARARGVDGRDDLLTVIDYTLPSTEPRLWVLDLEKGEVLYHELVAHGRGSGDKYATQFSNVMDSRQTSLGLFLTGGTYMGGNGYSLKLKGLDEGVNDRAEARHIVMHGAWYVSEEHARAQGRIGRSWGCPALSDEIASTVIDRIKGGSFVYSYSGSDEGWYQKASSSLGSCQGAPSAGAVTATVAAIAG